MSSSHFKQDLFTPFAHVGKAISNGNRLELLEFINTVAQQEGDFEKGENLGSTEMFKQIEKIIK